MEQPIIWQPQKGPQTEVLKRTEFEILYGGARGGGKTDAGMAWLLRHIDNPLYRALVIRTNYKDLADWIDRARQMYRGTNAAFANKPTEIRFPSGATFRTGHLGDPSSYEQYLGQEYQRMVIEELTLIPQEELYEKLLFSCRSTVVGVPPQVFCTTNPGGPGHAWVKQRFIEPMPWGEPYTYTAELKNPLTGDRQIFSRSRVFIHARIEDNPILVNADPGYVLMLDQLKKTNIGLYRAWRYGDWDIPAGQVFSEFRYETHVVKPFEIPGDWNHYLAFDPGSNKPFSVGFYAENFDGRVYLVDEIYMNASDFEGYTNRPFSMARLAKLILAKLKKMGWNNYQYMVCDPALWKKSDVGKITDEGVEGESGAEIMMRIGINLLKADNDRYNGLIRYREALAVAPDGKPWYQIFANCRNTIRTIPSLVYDIRASKIEDVDTTGEDHCYDRDRYFFMSRPNKPQEADESVTVVGRFYQRKIKEMIGEDEGSIEDYAEEPW